MAISNVSSGLRPGVCTSTTRPQAPFEGQMIFETDTDKVLVWNGTAWYPNWNQSWGIVDTTSGGTSGRGYIRKISGTALSATTTEADLADMTITFNALTTRLYRVSWHLSGDVNTAEHWTAIRVQENGTQIAEMITTSPAGLTTLSSSFAYKPTSSGSKTVKLRGATSIWTTSIRSYDAWPAYFSIEDIGPA